MSQFKHFFARAHTNIQEKFYWSTSTVDDIVLERQVLKSNLFNYLFCLYLLLISTYNLIYKRYSISITGYVYALIIIGYVVIFRNSKKKTLYIFITSLFFTIAICISLFTGAYYGSAVPAVAIVIVLIMNISGHKIGSIFVLIVLLCEVFVSLNNTKVSWIYTYPEIFNIFFIRFIAIHLGIFLFSLVSIKKQNELYTVLSREKEEKSQLFVNIVHDLKTPLTIIHNNIDKGLNGEKVSKELLKSNILKMENRVINLLNLNRLEKGIFDTSNVSVIDASTVSIEICSLFRDYALSKDIDLTFEIEPDIYVKIDETSFIEILNNLLDNAIKYTEAGGIITASLTSHNKMIILTVKDTGIGIDDSQNEKIFDSYYQAHRGFGNYYGLGIGLAFARKLSRAFGGDITYTSTVGVGSNFTVQLPKGETQIVNKRVSNKREYYTSSVSLEDVVASEDQKQKTLLLVEDNIDIMNLLIMQFKDNYNLLVAKNGKEGLHHYFSGKRIDLIITDIMMPLVDGKVFIETIKEKEGGIFTPIIVLTAKSDINDISDHLALGAVDYISKPFSAIELALKVESILSVFNNSQNRIVNNIGSNLIKYISNSSNLESIDSKKNEAPDSMNYKNLRKYSISPKEQVIIEGIAKGYTHKKIAESENISQSTVGTYVSRIYRKCGINNTASLIKIFYNS